jgi:hypothetical protein
VADKSACNRYIGGGPLLFEIEKPFYDLFIYRRPYTCDNAESFPGSRSVIVPAIPGCHIPCPLNHVVKVAAVPSEKKSITRIGRCCMQMTVLAVRIYGVVGIIMAVQASGEHRKKSHPSQETPHRDRE